MGNKRRGIVVFGLTAVAGVAMSIAASGAFAAQWYVAGPTLPKGETKSYGCEKASGTTLKIEGKIGVTVVTLNIGSVECVSGFTIQNEEPSPGVIEGTAKGKLKFKSITVSGLEAGCTAADFETKTVVGKVQMYAGLASTTGVEFVPASGTSFGGVGLQENCGGSSGEYPLKGVLVGETNSTKTTKVEQPLKFNVASNAASALTFASNPAKVTGELTTYLLNGQTFKSE
jgi:hypothetical protein